MSYVLALADISAADLPRVGGKGANLGELSRAGFPVPPGFCVTTAGFELFMQGAAIDYDELDALDGSDVGMARVAAARARAALERARMPDAVAAAVEVEEGVAYAVRSSATAEDLPDASFAGQQDTYLNVQGREPVLAAIRRCWISLFTDRAVLYRARNHFEQRAVKLSVVVQQMVLPDISGIMFTADPVSGRRDTASVEASYGLGEALVSGLVNADLYRVDKQTHRELVVQIGDKALAIRPLPGGGTQREAVTEARRSARVLESKSLRALVTLGVAIEAHYGTPQDIEWCIEAGRVFIVQARPITTLYPLPAQAQPGERIYLSFGHVQMMTNVMPPLAIELWQQLLPMQREGSHSRAVESAGSRIFLDVTPLLRAPLMRRALIAIMKRVYPTMADGLRVLTERRNFLRDAHDGRAKLENVLGLAQPILLTTVSLLLGGDPVRARTVTERLLEEGVEKTRARLRSVEEGLPRLRMARAVLQEFFAAGFLRVAAQIPSGIVAMQLIRALCGDTDDVRALERGLPGNVTTEMDLSIGDLIEVMRKAPNTELQSRPEWAAFLQRFGMRGPGEVDISRPRYKDDAQLIVATVRGGLSGTASARGKHQALAAEAVEATERLLRKARHGLFGRLRASLLRHLVAVARNGLAMREHPKFYLIRVLDLVRDVVRDAGKTLGVDDQVFLFRFDELEAALAGGPHPDLSERGQTLRRDSRKAPPFMMASDGEIPVLAAREGLPAGALPGTAASAGVVEGIAHVIHDPSTESLAAGEILVAPHTDPGWTPLFVHAAGLVTEVGGLITHGSVVAREYGIPAVVSVASATTQIRSGQRIRVDGTRGFVQILEDSAGKDAASSDDF